MVTNMKKYQKVEIVAKNQVAGSYAAGCPSKSRGSDTSCWIFAGDGKGCAHCDRAM
jgi:hypothetical protein